MTEIRRIKMKFGDAEFEADVQEDRVQPMYAQFLCTLQRRSRVPSRPIDGAGLASARRALAWQPNVSPAESSDQELLTRIFDLGEDGGVALKMLPTGPNMEADAMLLLLYGYYRLKNEECVLATQLFRAAEQSGISLRRPANEYARNARFVVRGGRRKGSHYALNSQGIAMAKEIVTKVIEHGESPPAAISAVGQAETTRRAM
jgi:hypothetical protein